jgi:hypothetical protein
LGEKPWRAFSAMDKLAYRLPEPLKACNSTPDMPKFFLDSNNRLQFKDIGKEILKADAGIHSFFCPGMKRR